MQFLSIQLQILTFLYRIHRKHYHENLKNIGLVLRLNDSRNSDAHHYEYHLLKGKICEINEFFILAKLLPLYIFVC